jgi:flavodoxin
MGRDRINQQVVEMIRERYSIEDELGILRTAPSDEATQYNAWVEECRAWGREEKTKFVEVQNRV